MAETLTAVWATVVLLVLLAVAGVVAAFADRRRAREIERDQARRKQDGNDQG